MTLELHLPPPAHTLHLLCNQPQRSETIAVTLLAGCSTSIFWPAWCMLYQRSLYDQDPIRNITDETEVLTLPPFLDIFPNIQSIVISWLTFTAANGEACSRLGRSPCRRSTNENVLRQPLRKRTPVEQFEELPPTIPTNSVLPTRPIPTAREKRLP